MQNKKFKKFGAVILAAAMILQSFGGMAGVSAAESTQMSSEKEVVYANVYSDAVREQDFDANWKFYLGDASGAEGANFDDSAWRNVSLPHDYSIEQSYTSAGEAESAYLLGGTGWYRKHFSLDPAVEGKTVRIDFGGVYMNATVWVNGTKLGTHPYGYTPFSFDITDYVKYDEENVITVKVDHKTPSSRWYSGSGIYRSVKLTVMDEVHVDLYGTQITTPNLEAEYAAGNVNIVVDTVVVNDSAKKVEDVTVTHEVYEKGSTKKLVSGNTGLGDSIAAGGKLKVGTSFSVDADSVKLWSVDDPALYTMVTKVEVGGNVVDTYEADFGFRYYSFDKNTGFYLNGEPLKLKGVCMHHDQGSLGAEAYARAIERQVEILKEMGCNAIRVTHNPAADEMIDACNRLGILIIEEAFDGWLDVKNGNTYDYSNWFDVAIENGNKIIGAESGMTWAEFDIKSMVNRGKNAPSIIMWSLGNEVQEGTQWQSTSTYDDVARNLINWVNEVDGSRLVTNGDNELKNFSQQLVDVDTVIANAGGVVGANYANGSKYDQIHNRFPEWPIYGSETASHVNSRGVYNVTVSQALNGDKALTAYDYSAVGWGATASSAWYDVITRDFVAGEFVWTGFDYMGEPTPNNGIGSGWVNGSNSPKNSFFGIIDTAGLPKDNYYFYQSQWNDDVTTLHVLPAWNRDVLANPNNVPVVVYSDAASVKLTLTTTNGTVKDLGTKTFVEKTTPAGYKYQMASESSTSDRDMYFTWYVPFEAGTITATAYDRAGNVITETVGRSFVTTTGDEAKINATVDRTEIKADGKDLAYVTIDVTDADGNIVPDAKNNVTVTVEGDGVLVGMDNGKQSDHQSFQDDNRNAFNGSLVAIVQSTKEAGEFKVTAAASGLTSDTVTVKTLDAGSEGDTSFFMSKNYYVQVGTAPVLPSTIETTLANGTVAELPVVWSEIDAADYAKAGTFAVAGVVDGKYTVSVTINVIAEVGGLLNYSTTTSVGVVPTLPAARPAVMLDGTILDAAFAVDWDDIDAADCAEVGTFVVDGTADVFGQKIKVTASVRVQEASITIGDSVSNQALTLTQDIPEDLQSDTLEAIKDNSTEIGANNGGGANPTAWSNYDASQAGDNTAEIVFEYATQQRIGEIVIHFWKDGYSAEFPDEGTTKIFVSENGDDWTEVAVKEIIGTETDRVKPYTYEMNVTSATFIKIAVTNSTAQKTAKACTGITEVELKGAILGGMTTNSSTGLSALRVNGVEATAADLADKFYTTDKTAVVRATGKDNAAVTVLPAYEGKVLVITEAEDHTSKSVYEVLLGQSKPSDPTSSSNDLPLSAMTYKTGSAQPASGNEGPIAYAFDGNVSTFWHSEWNPTWSSSQFQKYLWVEFDLKAATVVNGLRYLQRGGNGDITGYRIEGTADGTTWKTLTTGTWERTGDWVVASFEATELVAVKLVATSTYADSGNNRFASAKELRLTVPGAGSTGTLDKSVLEKVIAEAATYAKADYTADSWAALEAAVAAATAVNKDADADQAAVNAAVTAVDAAILALVKDTAETPVQPDEPKEEVCKVFVDVEHDAWYESSVQYVYDEGIIVGDGNVFAPNDATTRAMVAVILYRLAGSPKVTEADYVEYNKFTDLPKEHLWYSDAVAWALKEKVSTGDDVNMRYNPTSAVTREQLALFLYRYAEYTGKDVTVTEAYDELFGETYVADWAKEGFAWAIENGIIKGAEAMDDAGNTYYDLNPQGTATRAQFARVLHRYVGGAVD